MAITLVLTTFTALSVAAVGADGIAVISLATRRRWRDMAVIAAAWLAAAVVFELSLPTSGLSDWVSSLIITLLSLAFCVALGFYIGAQRDLVSSLHERAETAEREQGLRVAQARPTERARIAREMHDVLAHRISLVAMHSGALAYRSDLSAEETAEAATIVQDNAHQALSELRDVLGVLRDVDALQPVMRGPQPTLTDLDELVDETRSAGLEVSATIAVTDLGKAPEVMSRHGYRIVQEALTNARKHAEGMPVEVTVSGSKGDGLRMTVRNGIPAGGGGMPTSGPWASWA